MRRLAPIDWIVIALGILLTIVTIWAALADIPLSLPVFIPIIIGV